MLPFDVLAIVCAHLDAYSLAQVAASSSWLKAVVDQQDALWRKLAVERGFVSPAEGLGSFSSWKELYRHSYLAEHRWSTSLKPLCSVRSVDDLNRTTITTRAEGHLTVHQWGRILAQQLEGF